MRKMLIGLLAIGAMFNLAAIKNGLETKSLVESGKDGYATYRIPALLTLPPNTEYKDGVILAFYEGRKDGKSDHGSIDIILKRSTDNGKAWSSQQVIWADPGNTCGNPCPVYDSDTGKVFLLMCWNDGEDTEKQILDKTGKFSREVFVTESNDYGKTWSTPKNITKDTKDEENWTWYATGPGNGIQIENGKHAGRLVIPCNHNNYKDGKYYAHVIYSDDNGTSWKKSNSVKMADTNEDAVVELAKDKKFSDGDLMLNMRNQKRTLLSKKYRKVSYSKDGGINWENDRYDKTLITPRCQASLIRYSWPDISGNSNVILFSNPADKEKRKNLTVRASYDNGETWKDSRTIYSGTSAYSSLTKLNDNEILCAFEADDYTSIKLAKFNLNWIKGL
jgi:sialidase-1